MKYLDKLVSWFRSLFDEVDPPSPQEKEICNMLQEERNKVVKAAAPKSKSGKTIGQRKAIANRKKATPKTNKTK